MATLFVTLQGKGGVGKSFLTVAFAQCSGRWNGGVRSPASIPIR
jgi:MinD-like ATPase involved in chromosome partitioning or flagellar assembly